MDEAKTALEKLDEAQAMAVREPRVNVDEAAADLRKLRDLFRSVDERVWVSAANARHLADAIDVVLGAAATPTTPGESRPPTAVEKVVAAVEAFANARREGTLPVRELQAFANLIVKQLWGDQDACGSGAGGRRFTVEEYFAYKVRLREAVEQTGVRKREVQTGKVSVSIKNDWWDAELPEAGVAWEEREAREEPDSVAPAEQERARRELAEYLGLPALMTAGAESQAPDPTTTEPPPPKTERELRAEKIEEIRRRLEAAKQRDIEEAETAE